MKEADGKRMCEEIKGETQRRDGVKQRKKQRDGVEREITAKQADGGKVD